MDKQYIQKAVRDLKKDPKMKRAIVAAGPLSYRYTRKTKDPFKRLTRSIIGQQLSTKASQSIWKKMTDTYFEGKDPTPVSMLKTSIAKLRKVGLSNSKASYLHNLAQFALDEKLTVGKLRKLDNEAVIEKMTQVKGLGRWTVQMYLMFGLGRPDVLPVDDLGIRKGFMKVYGLRKLPDAAKMQKLAESWNGHYTVGCMYLWQSLDTE